MKIATTALILLMSAGPALAEMSAQLVGGWDGKKVPAGQHCKLHGGNGAAKSTGKYASPGYLPPCSGGRGNLYTVDLKAIDGQGKVLSEIKNFQIGRY